MRSWLLALLLVTLPMVSGTSLAATDNRTQPDNPFPVVKLETNFGVITVELNRHRAPKTVENFLSYVVDGHYDDTIFHRVVPGFVIQGGGLDLEKQHLPARAGVFNESGNGLTNSEGTIAMARQNDPHSGNRQFYFNMGENESLDPNPRGWGYAVFGDVVEGMEVLQKIEQVETDLDADLLWPDVPVKPVILQKATLVPAQY